jgi:AraC-like DNA-binding protein
VRANTFQERRRLYLLARVVVARHHDRPDLTVATVARALCCSSRQVQRAYAQFGERGFHEELVARRMLAAARLLIERDVAIGEVMRMVGYRHAAHFAATFRRCYGLSPARFRAQARCDPLGAGRAYGLASPAIAGSRSPTISQKPARRARLVCCSSSPPSTRLA